MRKIGRPLQAWAMLAGIGAMAPGVSVVSADDSIATAVYSQVGNGYKRTRLANGAFKPEYYAIADGGNLPGSTRDHTIDRVTYPQLAGKMAEFLGRQNYFLAKDKAQADLLIVLHRGATIPFNDINYSMVLSSLSDSAANGGSLESDLIRLQQENAIRDEKALENARMLGYLRELNDHDGIQALVAGRHYFQDLRNEVEERRYYVIVSAYDFRAATERKELKLLWVTRVSVSSQGHAFDRELTTMLASAHRHFGQDSGGLRRAYVREGRVDIGESEVIGVAPAVTPPKDSAPKP